MVAPTSPQRLRALLSWQANKVATVGARLTAQQMPPQARTDFAVLAALEEFGPLSQADLGRCLGLDRNDISTVASRLEGGTYVRRSPDPTDARRNRVLATAKGMRYLSDLQQRAELVQEALLEGFDPPEREQLQALLERVLRQHPGWTA